MPGKRDRRKDRQTDKEEIHGVAPEDSFWPHPDTWHHRTATGTELEPARTQMDGEDGVFVLGEGLRPSRNFHHRLYEPIISSKIESH